MKVKKNLRYFQSSILRELLSSQQTTLPVNIIFFYYLFFFHLGFSVLFFFIFHYIVIFLRFIDHVYCFNPYSAPKKIIYILSTPVNIKQKFTSQNFHINLFENIIIIVSSNLDICQVKSIETFDYLFARSIKKKIISTE